MTSSTTATTSTAAGLLPNNEFRAAAVLMPGARIDAAAHRYYVGDVAMEASVTERIANDIACDMFDGAQQASNTFALCERIRARPLAFWTEKQRRQFRRHGQYASAAAIAAAWEANRENGVRTHKAIELLLRGEIRLDDPRAQTSEVRIFLQFWQWFGRKYEVVASEAVLVDLRTLTGGTTDAAARLRPKAGADTSTSAARELVLVDWKTMAYEPIEVDAPRLLFFDLPKCKAAKQAVQLNLYAEMIERNTQYRVVELIVVCLDVELDTWDRIVVERRKPEAAAYFAYLEALRADGAGGTGEPLFEPAEGTKRKRTK